jgi:hypothetical protein
MPIFMNDYQTLVFIVASPFSESRILMCSSRVTSHSCATSRLPIGWWTRRAESTSWQTFWESGWLSIQDRQESNHPGMKWDNSRTTVMFELRLCTRDWFLGLETELAHRFQRHAISGMSLTCVRHNPHWKGAYSGPGPGDRSFWESGTMKTNSS